MKRGGTGRILLDLFATDPVSLPPSLVDFFANLSRFCRSVGLSADSWVGIDGVPRMGRGHEFAHQ